MSWPRKGCKPNSVRRVRCRARRENHLSERPVPGTRSTFADLETGRFGVPYLALLPMGFAVPRRLRFARCALTAPFHPYPVPLPGPGGLFSVALSVGTPRGVASRVYPRPNRGYAASRPVEFGLSSPVETGSDSPPFQNQDARTVSRNGSVGKVSSYS